MSYVVNIVEEETETSLARPVELHTARYKMLNGQLPFPWEESVFVFFFGSNPEPLVLIGTFFSCKWQAIQIARMRNEGRVTLGASSGRHRKYAYGKSVLRSPSCLRSVEGGRR